MIEKLEISDVGLLKIKDWFWGFAPKIISAILILIVGWWLIKVINRLIKSYFKKRDYDATLEGFTEDLINWGLKIGLFITVVTQLGVQSSSLIAMLGAAGLAIGLALQGSLSNFAGGVLILAFRPFKNGDFVEIQGVMGTVKEISIFTTKILTAGNELAILPNAKVSNDTIRNFSAEPTRKTFMNFGISYDSDIKLAKDILLDIVNKQELVLQTPVPEVVVTNLGDSSVTVSLRFWTNNEDYSKVNFYTREEAKSGLEAKGISIPFPQREVHLYNGAENELKKSQN